MRLCRSRCKQAIVLALLNQSCTIFLVPSALHQCPLAALPMLCTTCWWVLHDFMLVCICARTVGFVLLIYSTPLVAGVKTTQRLETRPSRFHTSLPSHPGRKARMGVPSSLRSLGRELLQLFILPSSHGPLSKAGSAAASSNRQPR